VNAHPRLYAFSATMAESEVKGSAPKGVGPLFLCLSLPRREDREALDRLEPLFRVHLPHKRHRTLIHFIQIIPRRVLFDETGIRPVESG
jgi:hypothetical protein